MRAVRCEVCGAKAMTAAAQCPSCGHQFELRDGFGELFPLAYCSSCNSYYRESLGECRWCHTKPERAPIAPRVWQSIGVAALVVLVGTGWFLRRGGTPDTTSRRTKTATKTESTSRSEPLATDTALVMAATATGDTAVAPTTTVARAETVVRDVTPPPTTMAEPPAPLPQPSAPAARSTKSRPASRWVSSISRDWVVIRADANKRSRLVASIGPNSRVQLGESRGEWRRIRARGLAGWVEQRAEFRVATR